MSRFVLAVGALLPILVFDAGVASATSCSEAFLADLRTKQDAVSEQWEQIVERVAKAEACTLQGAAAVLAAHADLAVGRNNQAHARFVLVRADETVNSWRRWTEALLAENPASSAANYLAGDALARSKDFAGAIARFDEAIAIDSTNALAYNARGVARAILYQASEDPKGRHADLQLAVADFRRATTLHPGFVDAHINRALAEAEAGLWRNAKEHCRSALEHDATSGLAHNTLAILLSHEQDIEEAKKHIVLANQHLPYYPYVVMNARALAEGSDADDLLKRIALLDPEAAQLDESRGWSNSEWTRFSHDLRDFSANTFSAIGSFFGGDPGSIRSATNNLYDLTTTYDYSKMMGGVYLDVTVQKGTRRVASTFGLDYPRPSAGEER